tara:strand:+ start:132 stop:500 length:369 start_codon:yes stop_codon:yes gene_type:complete
MAFKMKGFKAHDMYEPETGKKVVADTYQEHLELGKKGYTHKSPKQQNNDRQPPLQPGENPDTEVYEGTNLVERIIDLEDRIGFLKSDIAKEAGPTEKKVTMTQNLKLLQAKLKDLKSRKNDK